MLPDNLLLSQFCAQYRNLDVNATGSVIKAAPGHLHNMVVTNNGAVTLFVKLYDKATTAVAADTPLYTVGVPAGWVQPLINDGEPIIFNLGIGVRCTTGVADADNTSPTANAAIMSAGFK